MNKYLNKPVHIMTSVSVLILMYSFTQTSKTTDANLILNEQNLTADTSESDSVSQEAYIVSLDFKDSSITGGITRMQMIELIDHRKVTAKEFDINDINRIMKSLVESEPIPYDEESLALQWEVENDSVIYMRYISEPVKTLIYVYDLINDRKKGLFYPDELIWVSDSSIYRNKQKYRISDEFRDYVKDHAITIDASLIEKNSSVITPNNRPWPNPPQKKQ